MVFDIRDDCRRQVILGLMGVFLLAFGMTQWLVLPSWDRFKSSRSALEDRQVELARLRSNIAVAAQVGKAHASLPAQAWRVQDDEEALSYLLVNVESAARSSDLSLVNARPLPVKTEPDHRTYRVRIVLSGRLEQIVRFVDRITSGDALVGLDGFTLRGEQGENKTEATFEIVMIRLRGLDRAGSTTQPTATEDSDEP